MDKDIISIAKKYKTDKNDHGYMEFYQKHLPDNPKRLLEIGVHKGESIKMWKEIFPNTQIHGLDLFEEFPIPDDCEVTWWKGSQTDPRLLKKLATYDFDIIIDDGSHGSMDQWVTFEWLKTSTKLYVIEDLHTANESFWRQGIHYDETILGQMKSGKFPYTHSLYLEKIGFIYAP